MIADESGRLIFAHYTTFPAKSKRPSRGGLGLLHHEIKCCAVDYILAGRDDKLRACLNYTPCDLLGQILSDKFRANLYVRGG